MEHLPRGKGKTAETEGQPLPSHSLSSNSHSLTNNPPSIASTQQNSIFDEAAEASMPPVNPTSLKRALLLGEAHTLVNAAVPKYLYRETSDYFPTVDGGYQQSVHSQFLQFREGNTYWLLYNPALPTKEFYKPLIPPDQKPVSGAYYSLLAINQSSSSSSSSSVISTAPTQIDLNIFIGAVAKNDSKAVQSQLAASSEKRKVQLINGEGEYNIPIQGEHISETKRANALVFAAKNGFIDIVRIIFDAISDPNLKKEILQKRPAFDAAAESGQADVLKMFLEEMQKSGINLAEYICAMTPRGLTTFLSCIEKEERQHEAPTSVSQKSKSQKIQPTSSSSSSSNSQNGQQIVNRNGAARFISQPKSPASNSSSSVINTEPTQANINAFITAFLSSIESGYIELVCAVLEEVDPKQRFGLTFDPIGNGTKKLEGRCAFNVATKHPKIFAAMLDLVRPTEKEIFDLLISESYGKMVFHSLLESRNSDPEALRKILNSIRHRVPDLFHEFYKKTGRTPLFSLVNMCNILTSSSHHLGISVLLSFVDEDERMDLITALTTKNGLENRWPEEGHVGKSALAYAAESSHAGEVDAMLSSLSEQKRLRAIKSEIAITNFSSGNIVRLTNSFLLAVSRNALSVATTMLRLIPLPDAVALVREAETLVTVPAGSTILAALNNYLLERRRKEQATNSAPRSSSSSSRSHGGGGAKEREGEIPAPLSPNGESKSSKAEVTATTNSTPISSSSSSSIPKQSTNASAFHIEQRRARKSKEREQEREREREQPNVSQNGAAKSSPLPKPPAGKK
jgi:ribosome-associated translation inhibitor RaiA